MNIQLRREYIYIGLIFIVAYAIRGIPSWFNWGWGNDFGIYYGLTKGLIEDPQLFRPYSGWGEGYQYFPMLYIITAALHSITGLEVDLLLRIISPIIGALAVAAFYLVVRYFNAGPHLAVLAALILALNPFHAYQTSHAAPLTVGHLFLVLSLLFFLYKDRKPWATHALYLTTIMLIMSHHLTTFVYIIFIIGIILFRGLNSKKFYNNFTSDLIYLISLSILNFAYWAFIATHIYYKFMAAGLGLPPGMIVVMFYIFIGLMVAVLALKYRLKLDYKPRLFSNKLELKLVIMTFFIILGGMALLSIMDIGTGFKFFQEAPILLLPTILVLSVAVIGLNRIDFEKYGPIVNGLFYPSLGLLGFSIITWNNVLLPFRFLEYIAYPLCILSAIGIITLIKLDKDQFWPKDLKLKAILAIFIGAILLSGASTYAVQRVTSGYTETISQQVIEGLDFVAENAAENATVATDHRISTLVWERGFNTTYDYAYDLWFATRWNSSGCLSELQGHGIGGREYGRVGYIVIDSVMVKDGVQSNTNATPRPITAISYEKFNHEPFHLVFESKSRQKLMDEDEWDSITLQDPEEYPYIGQISKPLPNAQEWCRVYSVNWSYIQTA